MAYNVDQIMDQIMNWLHTLRSNVTYVDMGTIGNTARYEVSWNSIVSGTTHEFRATFYGCARYGCNFHVTAAYSEYYSLVYTQSMHPQSGPIKNVGFSEFEAELVELENIWHNFIVAATPKTIRRNIIAAKDKAKRELLIPEFSETYMISEDRVREAFVLADKFTDVKHKRLELTKAFLTYRNWLV